MVGRRKTDTWLRLLPQLLVEGGYHFLLNCVVRDIFVHRIDNDGFIQLLNRVDFSIILAFESQSSCEKSSRDRFLILECLESEEVGRCEVGEDENVFEIGPEVLQSFPLVSHDGISHDLGEEGDDDRLWRPPRHSVRIFDEVEGSRRVLVEFDDDGFQKFFI